MDTKFKQAAFYAGGTAIGAAIGVFIATFVIDVIQTQQYYRENQMTDEQSKTEEEGEVKPSRFVVSEKQIVDYNTIAGKKVSKALIEKYNLKGDLPTEEEVQVTQYTDPVEEVVVNVDRSKPYPITLDSFEDKTYPKSKLVFYNQDEVVADQKGKEIKDYESFLGKDLINMFGVLSEDKDIVYIRNEQLGADYQIILVDEAFREEEDEDEDEDPRMRRTKRVAE